jgi:transcriptional regulator with XRE-family HTH domain
LRQLDLAEQAGISENYVSELELGQKEICLRTIDVLSKALGIAIDEIVKGIQ